MSEDLNYIYKVIRKILNIVLIIIAIYIGIKMSIFYMPFLIAFLISLIIEPAIKYLMKKTKMTRKMSSIIIFIIAFSIIIGSVIWGTTTLISESTNLLQALNIYIDKAYTQIQDAIGKMNITKIISIINERNTNKISAEVLSEYMGITVRSANRILNTLCKYNAATITEEKTQSKRGRPKKSYIIDFSKLI